MVSIRAFAVTTSPVCSVDELSPVSVHVPSETVVVPSDVVVALRVRKISITVPGDPDGPDDVPETDVSPARMPVFTVGTGDVAVVTVTLLDVDDQESPLLFTPFVLVSIRAFAATVSPGCSVDEIRPERVHALAVTDVVPRDVVTPLRVRKISINVPGVPSGPDDVPDTDADPPIIGEVTVGTGETGAITVTLDELLE